MRRWLEDNSSTEQEVYVHCKRREYESIMSYLDVVDEALCFGWIDSTTRSSPDEEGYLQRLSSRRKGSYWTELNKERCRRLIKLGLMTPAGKKTLPSLAKNSFKPDQWITDAIKADKQVWKNHKTFHPLYVRIRLYNIMFYIKRNGKGDKETAMKMLDRYIKYTHDGKMYGEWYEGIFEDLFIKFPLLAKIIADEGYHGEQLANTQKNTLGCELEIVLRPNERPSKFYVLPKRWIVGRSFA